MTLSINSDFDRIAIASDLLDSFIANPSAYSKIEVTGKINCSETGTTHEFKVGKLITNLSVVQTNAGAESIVPAFFGTTTFGNGIYGFSIQLTTLLGTTTVDAGCLFVDVDIRCSIPADNLEKQMLHYVLTMSQDCSCNCQQLCDIYNELTSEDSSANCSHC